MKARMLLANGGGIFARPAYDLPARLQGDAVDAIRGLAERANQGVP